MNIKINAKAMIDFLKDKLDVSELVTYLEGYDFGSLGKDKTKILFFALDLAPLISEAIQKQKLIGMDSKEAIAIGSEAFDILLEFSGTDWGIVPTGMALEYADRYIANLLLEAGYRLLKGKFGGDKATMNAALKEKFGL